MVRWLWLGVLVASAPQPVQAAPEQRTTEEAEGASLRTYSLRPPTDVASLVGRPIREMVLVLDDSGPAPVRFDWAPLHQPFSPSLARQALRELLRSGRFAALDVEVDDLGDGVRLRFVGTSRYVVSQVVLHGNVLALDETLEATRLGEGHEITRPAVAKITARLWQLYQDRGFPYARISGRLKQLPNTQRVDVIVRIEAGRPLRITDVRFQKGSVHSEQQRASLAHVVQRYGIVAGDRADELALRAADERMTWELKRRGFRTALVRHQTLPGRGGAAVLVDIAQGPATLVRFEGNHTFDSAVLHDALELGEREDVSVRALVSTLENFYAERGFLDIQITPKRLHDVGREDLLLQVHEGSPIRIVARTYPCLDGGRTPQELDAELDAFLRETLPGGDDLVEAVHPGLGRQHLQPEFSSNPPRPDVFRLEPAETYTPSGYDKAVAHLRDLFRSEGYLGAEVGPAVLLRRQCTKNSSPGACQPIGERETLPLRCDETPRTLAPTEIAQSPCVEDPTHGIYCESKAVLSIPVQRGPQTSLWDVQFRGNHNLLDAQLGEVAALQPGAPLSQVALQEARRHLLDLYADHGFAFASVEATIELSADKTRGLAVFNIGERAQVRVADIQIRGAERTSHGLILSRLELQRGDLFRRDKVRESEEQLATLGTFASVKIGLLDPDVPARSKTVVVTVSELPSQYVDLRPGVSTGEGWRARLEYGHRNVGSRAIQARLRVQLGYLPDWLIFDNQVRQRFTRLEFSDRLERRNTLTFEFPIAKRLRLTVDGVDARDNSRDFGLTKRAGLLTFGYRPSRAISLQIGASFELNDARIFNATESLETYLRSNPQLVRLLNVPDGRSFALAGRIGANLDRTDNPLGATRGYRLSAEIEPVIAFLSEDNVLFVPEQCSGPNATSSCEFKSRFLKVTQSMAGYIPFNDAGLSLALSLRWGANIQLVPNSSTYPDRLFFFGGGDSLRGFLQASVIPQDIAAELRPGADATELHPEDVVIRGGDFVLNPRAELRIPLTKSIHTAVFVDSGNVWRKLENVDPTQLRYTAGTGIRAITPIGPLAFDYGIKLDPRFYDTSPGAFHFSVGLF